MPPNVVTTETTASCVENYAENTGNENRRQTERLHIENSVWLQERTWYNAGNWCNENAKSAKHRTRE
jgi:hypothetical protein